MKKQLSMLNNNARNHFVKSRKRPIFPFRSAFYLPPTEIEGALYQNGIFSQREPNALRFLA